MKPDNLKKLIAHVLSNKLGIENTLEYIKRTGDLGHKILSDYETVHAELCNLVEDLDAHLKDLETAQKAAL